MQKQNMDKLEMLLQELADHYKKKHSDFVRHVIRVVQRVAPFVSVQQLERELRGGSRKRTMKLRN